VGVEIFEGLQTSAPPRPIGWLSDGEGRALLIIPNEPLYGIVRHVL